MQILSLSRYVVIVPAYRDGGILIVLISVGQLRGKH